jgi:protein-disulfide isomerase
MQILADDDPVKGDQNAPVTIVEFSDFQCPFCGRFWSQTLPQIKEDYIDTGKVKFVYRDFPLSFHQYAQKASEAAECADEQGKFWEYHDKLFENQQFLDTESLKQYAADLGLDTEKFNSCIDTGKYSSEVRKDFQDGQTNGVSGTPTFFINGQKLVGAQPYSAFQQIIDSLISE